jgi:hypothetical protein
LTKSNVPQSLKPAQKISFFMKGAKLSGYAKGIAYLGAGISIAKGTHALAQGDWRGAVAEGVNFGLGWGGALI